MHEKITIIKRIRMAEEKLRRYSEQQDIRTVAGSLNSNLTSYLKELKTYYWRLNILLKVFNDKPDAAEEKEIQEISSSVNTILMQLNKSLGISQLTSANETIQKFTKRLSEINVHLSTKIHEGRKALERIIVSKTILTKIKDLRGYSILKAEDEQFFKDKISTRLYSPTQEDVIKEFKEFYNTWTNFGKQLKSVHSLDLLKDKYGMSQETVNIIQKLCDGEKINLLHLDSKVLNEIQKLQEFCKTVSLRIE